MWVRVPPYPPAFVLFSCGFSSKAETKEACREAFEEALSKLEQTVTTKDILAMIFLSYKYAPDEVLKFFKGIDIIGLTTAGNIMPNGEFKGERSGITVNLINKRHLYCETFSVSVIGRRPREIGNMIAERFRSPFSSSIILFACPFYEVDEILQGIGESSDIQVSGGIASTYKNNTIFMFENDTIGSYMVGGVFIEGVRVRYRTFQSCKVIGERFLVTSAYENVIEEIDGVGAEEYLWDLIPLEELGEAAETMWFVAIPIDDDSEIHRFVPILEIKDGKIFLGGEVETGRVAYLAFFSPSVCLESAERESADLPKDADFGLLFSCISRGFGFKKSDIAIINRKNGNRLKFQISGLLTNGEIVTIRRPMLLNYTAVLSLFSRQMVM